MPITIGNGAGIGAAGPAPAGTVSQGGGLGAGIPQRDWRTMAPEQNYVPGNISGGDSYFQQQLSNHLGELEGPQTTHYQDQLAYKDYVDNTLNEDDSQSYEPGTDAYYNAYQFTQFLPTTPNESNIESIRNNKYMDGNIYSDEWLNREYRQRLPQYGSWGASPPADMAAAWNARLKNPDAYGFAAGGVVPGGGAEIPEEERRKRMDQGLMADSMKRMGLPGYADGGVIPDEGLSEFEQNLIQSSIAALNGDIQNQDDANEILAELEATFGEGAVEELANEIAAQSGEQGFAHGGVADGMDDSVAANLTPGELVVSNPQLADYGNGDRAVGAEKLQAHLANVSNAHRGSTNTPQRVNPAAMA
jgi:hypothetical protein